MRPVAKSDARAVGPLGWSIRAAARGDLARIAEIEAASFSDPWSQRAFGELLGERRIFFAVAEGREGLLGYIVAWFVSDEGEIANLAVAPDVRRSGVGAALLDAALGAASEHGVSSVYLEVRESNSSARALYASRGFAEIGRRRSYYRRPAEDAIVLRCAFDAMERARPQ